MENIVTTQNNSHVRDRKSQQVQVLDGLTVWRGSLSVFELIKKEITGGYESLFYPAWYIIMMLVIIIFHFISAI